MVDPKKRPIQWHWMAGAAALDIPALDPVEAVAMKLVQTYLKPLLPGSMLKALAPYFETSERVLSESGALGPGKWTRRIRVLPKGMQTLAPKVNNEAQNAVYDALLKEKRLALDYRGRGQDDNKKYHINPHGLVVRDNVIYLVASLVANDELRQFVLHRLKSACVLDEAATTPSGFDLDKYIEQGEFGWPLGMKIRLEAIFSKGAAKTFSETPISTDQTLRQLEDGQFRMTATVLETMELKWWLMSFGPEVEVVAPKKLRVALRDAIRQSAKRYLKT